MSSLSLPQMGGAPISLPEATVDSQVCHINCRERIYVALHVISALGIALSLGMMSEGLVVPGAIAMSFSLGLAVVNEFFGFSSASPQQVEPMVPTISSPPRVRIIAYNGREIVLPDPGARLEGTGIDSRHFIEALDEERAMPLPPENVRVEDLLHFQNKINFTNPDDPCYVFRGGPNFYNSYGREQAHSGFERFRALSASRAAALLENDLRAVVDKVNDRTDRRTQDFFRCIMHRYSQIEQGLIDPTSLDYIPNNDSRIVEGSANFNENLKRSRDRQIQQIDARNQGIEQLMAGLDGCDNRMRMETYEVYRKVIGQAPTDLESDVKERLKDLRFNILTIIANNRCNDTWLPEINQSVQYLLGPTRGVTEHIYLENYPNRPEEHRVSEETAYHEFNELYNRSRVIETVREWLNGVDFIPERGRGHSEIEIARIHEWFANHVPRGRNQENYLSEDVYENFAGNDFRIKEGAVAYFLQTIGVITANIEV